MARVTGLSGNEMYCLGLKGYRPGDLVVGNSVWSLGIGAGLASIGRVMAGGEVKQFTDLINEGRRTALGKLLREAEQRGGQGLSGVTTELINQAGTIEFLSIGSCLHDEKGGPLGFSTSADGQELYCQLDCGFQPIRFVFGNVAYSIGIGGGLKGSMRSLARGEVKEFSQVFNKTRHLALERISAEAKAVGANAVLGIRTTIAPFSGSQEMIMIGTASHHPSLPPEFSENPITSDLTNQEMWNVIRHGYCPIRLVLGVSVYSLGVINSFTSFFKAFSTGEIPEMTSLIYDARENAVASLGRDAQAAGADEVVGVRTYIKHYNGMVEFMAIGTAVKRIPGIEVLSENLPAQAVIVDQDTFVQPTFGYSAQNLNAPSG